jgi:putative iron-regulated protein
VLACARPELTPELAKQGLTTYADIARAGYEDALVGAQQLAAAVDALVSAPSEQTLRAARDAWHAARAPYLQTETYRFYEGPIDRVELLVNTWPIDESYVESVIADAQRYPNLSPALLVELNAQGGETSISAGYHVIEFLLWGRDTHDDRPGSRPVSDFVGPRAERPRRYLALASELLVTHLTQVVSAWRGAYRSELLALPPKLALTRALRGMGALSGPELSGERLTVPFETRDQENEQSCFSDSTDRDVRLDARGVQNVCLGRYRRTDGTQVEGPGICALVSALDPKLGKALEEQVAASVRAAEGIPAPFDRALAGSDDAPGRAAIKRTVDALQAQTESITRAIALLGAPP